MKWRNLSMAVCTIVCIVMLSTSACSAQQFTEVRMRYSAGSTVLTSAVLPDGSKILGGYVLIGGNLAVLTKIDSSGAVIWSRTITIAANASEIHSVTVASDGSILAIGQVVINGIIEPVLLSFTAAGNLNWYKHYTFSSPAAMNDHIRTSDGGILIRGNLSEPSGGGGTRPFTFLLKTDSLGTPLWAYTVNLPSGNHVTYGGMVEGKDATILLVGFEAQIIGNAIAEALLITQLGPTGNIISRRTYQAAPTNLVGLSILQCSDGSFVGGGYMETPDRTMTPMLFHYSISTGIDWISSYSFFELEALKALYERPDGKLVAFTIGQLDFPTPPHLFIVSRSGTLEAAGDISPRLIQCGALNHYPGNPHLLAISTNDISNNERNIDVITASDELKSCAITPLLGTTAPIDSKEGSSTVVHSPLTITADSIGLQFIVASAFTKSKIVCSGTDEVQPEIAKPSLALYPNPLSDHTAITVVIPDGISNDVELRLRDLTGREVYRTHREAASSGEQIQIPTAGLASGVYTVELLDANSFANVWRGKVVVE